MPSTCSYNNYNSNFYRTYSISGVQGKNAEYTGACLPKLEPKYSFLKIWHDNIGKIPQEENIKYYIEEYYKQVLSNLEPEELSRELRYSILLCYEDSAEFCHRHIVAAWLEILLDIEVPEIKVTGYKIEKLERPTYIKGYLEDAMKKNINMRGFNSLRALYLFEQGEKLEQKAYELEQETGKNYDNYRQAACYLRCDADEAEFNYNKKHNNI